MYLKSIEIQGFKSFAHKIKFEFHNGITGIVGPNGSGKSNVSDAVRWVFGEQSAKQLRGGHMQDVIFAGTQLRKPQSYASVKITLDNADRALKMDTDEVAVTRKLFRSGESEYMLNGDPCRLRDVQELFYDTGIGKDGYSIIGQGQIDKILSGKAEERRELFDEACGIVKYKKRKKETLKKLESERDAMVRVTDIVKELEKQTGPLARQSETAKVYLKLREELKTYDLNAFLIDHQQMTGQLAHVDESLKLVEGELEEKTKEDQDLRQKYSDLDDTLQEIDTSLAALHESLTAASQRKAELEGRINVVLEQINTEKNNTSHYESRIAEIGAETASKKTEIEAAEENRKEILKELEKTAAEAEDAKMLLSETELKLSLMRESVEEQHGKMISLLNEKSEVSAKLESLNTLITQHELRKEELKNRLDEIDENASQIVCETQALDNEIREQNDTLASLNAELEKAQAELADAVQSLNQTQRDLNDMNQRYQVSKSRLETLRSMAERYEGFNNAVRRVMDIHSKYPGICGVVADLIRVEPKYTTAIETALGGSIQNIVTEDEDTAKRLVRFLKENKAGRATFLPLDNIRPSGASFDRNVFKEPGAISTADKLVGAEAKYDKVIRYLLERFLVFDNIDNALAAMRKYHQSLRIVTLEGDQLQPGGSITGGAFKTSSNLLGRNKELETLEKDAENAKKKIGELTKKLNQFRQIKESTDVEIEDIEEDIRNTRIRAAELKADQDGKNRSLTALALEKKDSEGRLSEVVRELKEAESERRTISGTIQELENIGTENTDSQEEIRKEITGHEQELGTLQKKSGDLALRISELTQNADFQQQNKERLLAEVERLGADLEELNRNIADSGQVIESYNAEIVTLRQEFEGAAKEEQEIERQVSGCTEKRETLNSSQHEFFGKRDELNSVIADLTKNQLQLQTQHEKLNERLDSQTEYLWTEYEITPSEAESFRDETLDNPVQVRRHAAELKSQIKGLGNVNVNAIEQYKEVAERYEFMTGQYDDLCKAEKSLLGIIEDLDTGMRKQFSENFALIQEKYNSVFKEMFGGGQGTIELEAGVDVIDADITVISQPPGKKLQNMMQLSGGEKALSAIALIFAIQSLKPSPFCLLDEIEAALDESNVGRFAQYLKKLTGNTQFIVITHRRGTMVAADRLYGITMQEKGVSTLVSVNLVEDDLDA